MVTKRSLKILRILKESGGRNRPPDFYLLKIESGIHR
jgi:hypothetical protein